MARGVLALGDTRADVSIDRLQEGETPLIAAWRLGCVEVVELLAEWGAASSDTGRHVLERAPWPARNRVKCEAAVARGRRKFELRVALSGALPQSGSVLRSHLSSSYLCDMRVWLVVAQFV